MYTIYNYYKSEGRDHVVVLRHRLTAKALGPRLGGVINSPRSIFLGFFSGVESCAAAHGLYRCAVYRLLSEPMSTRLLNSISSRICRQNT